MAAQHAFKLYSEGTVLRIAVYRLIATSLDTVDFSDEFTAIAFSSAIGAVPPQDIPSSPTGPIVTIDPANAKQLQMAPVYILVVGSGKLE